MITQIARSSALGALFMAGLLVQGQVTLAATTAEQPRAHDITVVGSRGETVNTKVIGRTAFGGKLEVITVKRNVNYGDLNLVKHADVVALQSRVDNMARTECSDLTKMYPLVEANNHKCAEEAIEQASGAVNGAIAAAEK